MPNEKETLEGLIEQCFRDLTHGMAPGDIRDISAVIAGRIEAARAHPPQAESASGAATKAECVFFGWETFEERERCVAKFEFAKAPKWPLNYAWGHTFTLIPSSGDAPTQEAPQAAGDVGELVEDIDYVLEGGDELGRVTCRADLLRQAASLLSAQEAEIEQLSDAGHAMANALAEHKAKCDSLQAFKNFVHARLDEAGVATHPDGPHSKEGCRIGDRLDLVFARIEALEKAAEPFVVAANSKRSFTHQDGTVELDWDAPDDHFVHCSLGSIRALALAARPQQAQEGEG